MKKLFALSVMLLVLFFSTNIFAQVSFSVKTDFTLGSSTNSLTHADINGDGKQDIIATRQVTPKKVTVLLNTTAIGAVTPTFSAATDFEVGGANNSSIAVADLNGDGKPDIVVTESSTGTISVLLNTTSNGAPTPTFSTYTSFPGEGVTPRSIAIGDVNGDGKPDIIAANFGSTVSVLLNTTLNGASTPTFSSKTNFTVGASPLSVAIADLNGDGKPDIVTANDAASGTVSVLLNTTSNGASTPTFSSKTDFAVGASPYFVAIADLNGDNKPDIVSANYSANTVSVLLNTTSNGAATPAFTVKEDFAVGTSPYWIAIDDFDGDGKSDIVTANQSASGTVSVLLNTTTNGASTPTFSIKSDFAVGSYPTSVTNADINGDNKPDIITSNTITSTTAASVLLNTTNTPPTFTSTPVTAVNGNEIYTYGITTADAENDVVTVTASLPSGWPTLTTSTQVTTFAGSTYGFADGTGAAAQFKYPRGVAIDASGTVYVADESNNRIRKITSAGVVTTLAGSTGGFADGTGAAAQFWQPFDVDVDASGNVYVADSYNHSIRKITPDGLVTTLAGAGTPGVSGFANGTGSEAKFYGPQGVAVDASGNVYVADSYNHKIRKITPAGVVTTFAGSTAGFTDATGTDARFNQLTGIAVDASGNVYVGDYNNHRIRKVTSLGVVTTLAGSGVGGFADGTGAAAQFYYPDGVTLDALGNVYVADQANTKIRKITPAGVVTTLAGSTSGYADGLGTTAQFSNPSGIAIDAAGILYVGDQGNNKIRKITPAGVLTADATGRVGDYAVDISANDGNGGITHQIFTITVSTVLTKTGNWNTAGNWSSASVPLSTHHAVIPSGKSATVDITNGVVNNLTVNGTLAISAGNALTVSGNLINTGTFTINSDASSNASNGSLILNGASTGNITYNRYVTGIDKWHLVSSPVGAQDINAFVVTNVATNAVAAIEPKYGLAPYDNSTPGWTHYTTGTIGSAGSFTAGKGYEVLRTSDGTVAFTGTVATSDVGIGITKPVAPGNAWNLIGNPFPSAVKGNSPADVTNNFISVNTAALDDAYEAIYVWDAASSSYLTVNHTYNSSSAFYVAPGQAFFVYSVADGASVSFTEAMQTHQTGNIFKNATIQSPSIKLIAERTEGSTSTNILYLESMTTGLDPGYDAGRFSGGNNSFAVYTHLAGDNTNPVDFDIQCLPANEWDHIIPVGLNAPKNTEVVFRAEVMSLPTDVPVYLEDKVTGTFTVLNEPGSFYTVKFSEQSQGAGRFFLHTKSSVTGIGPLANEADFSIIPRPQYNNIRVIGRFDSESQISVYDMAGRKLLSRKLNATEINDVEMNGIISGVYVVYISSSPTKSSGKKLNWIKN